MWRAAFRGFWLLHLLSPFPLSPYVGPGYVLTGLVPLLVAGTCGMASTFAKFGVSQQRVLHAVAVFVSFLTAFYRYASRVFALMQALADVSLEGFIRANNLLVKGYLQLISGQLERRELWGAFMVSFNEFVVPAVSLGLVVHLLASGCSLPFASEASPRVNDAGRK